jgi:TonB-linked SusC/RagA family outer membrane protein
MRKLFLILMAVLACTWSLSAQTKTIHGTVLDAGNNEPLIGATIMPVGGGQGAAADLDGHFTVTVPAKVSKATVSYVGYTSKTVDLHDGMTVYLASSTSDLDEVIVVAYGTANKESLTGSVAVVGAKEIEDRPVTTATAALEGNAPGVQVNNTYGSPGSEPSIRIRGFSSVNGSNAPLYVVDGVPYESGISDINPADIESISVLKDAASSALYGNKGSNGVILITTKKAKKVGKVDVNLSINQGLYTRGIGQYDKLGTDEWMEQVWKGYYNQYATTTDWTPEYISNYLQNRIISNNAIPVNLYGVDNDKVFDANGKLTSSVLPGYNDLDWWDAISRQGYRQEYAVNAAGATDNFNVFASFGYLKENGYLLQTDFERYTGRVNANFQPTKYLKLGLNLNAAASEGNQNDSAGTSYTSNPFSTDQYSPIYPYYSHDAEGNIEYDAQGNRVWNTASYLNSDNLAYALRLNYQNYTVNTINATAYGTVLLPYGFDVTVRGNLNKTKERYSEYVNNVVGSGVTYNGLLYEGEYQADYSTFMQTLNWSHDYGYHHVDALLDHENYQYFYSYFTGQENDQSFNGLYILSNFNSNPTVSGSSAEDRTESYLGRARYNYMQKYFGEVSFRRDGSSRFSKDNRWGNFWSVGASWVISKEKFMNALPWVNYAKLRAAYGTVGNNASASTFNYLNNYGLSTYFGTPSVIPSNIASQNLKWETTKSFDIALEGSVLDDRLNFSIGYFDKRSTDLIFAVPMPRSAGSIAFNWSNPTVSTNIGTMSNRGWELSFGVDILRTKDFYWTASVDATFLKNKIVKLPGGSDITGTQRVSEGHSLYEWYTVHYAGVDQLTGNALYELDPNAYEFTYLGEQDGTDRFNTYLEGARSSGSLVEIDGKYYVTDSQYASSDWRGTALPTVYGSFGTNFSWKGLTLGVLFTYSLGGKTYDTNYNSLMQVSQANSLTAALHRDVLKAWTAAPEGMTETSPNRIDPNGIPQFNFANNLKNNAYSDRFLTSSDYLVFKNLNVSYSLPEKWVAPLQMQNLSIGFAVENLFTITSRKGLNPQYSFNGAQSTDFTTARVFSFSINAKF